MKTSGTTVLCVVLLELFGRRAVEGWTSYLQSLSSPPVTTSTAPPSHPSSPKIEDEPPPETKILMKQQGDYLSYLSSPRPLLTSQGDYNVGLLHQPAQPIQPAVAREIIKSTTGTDYLSRLSSESVSSSPSRQKVVYAANPAETTPIGATDYLSQLSVRPRDKRTTAPKEDSTFQSEVGPFLATSTSDSTSESQNGANYQSFLSSPTLHSNTEYLEPILEPTQSRTRPKIRQALTSRINCPNLWSSLRQRTRILKSQRPQPIQLPLSCLRVQRLNRQQAPKPPIRRLGPSPSQFKARLSQLWERRT
jgi:hypothetical protein